MTSVILKLARKMPRSPKNTIKSKIKAVKIVEAANTTVVAVAAAVGVDRSTIHRSRKNVDRLTTAARPNRQLVDPHPQLEKRYFALVSMPIYYFINYLLYQCVCRLLEWIVDMRKNRYLWVSTNCLLLMHSKFAPVLFASRSRGASLMFIRRFLKRNRLTAVANVFSHSILRNLEEDGILSFLNETEKYSSVYNINQTAMYVDMNGRTTIDFVGASTVDVVQDKPFPATPREKRELMSRIVAQAWDAIPAKVIVNGFIKSGLIHIGPATELAALGFLKSLLVMHLLSAVIAKQSKKYIARFFVWIIHNMQNVCSTQLGVTRMVPSFL
ncbi:hypothetical protein GQ600_3766 [Phytophthora cactorum]|nr:hypothetical protein GQ600_3766 [Phytophthora cactorum]